MKAFLVVMLTLVMVDIAINHGDATNATVQALGDFWRWLSQAAAESIFSR
jgi:hypothetical protein